jgi:predicted DsbA family dithiol-disulfide isomerase
MERVSIDYFSDILCVWAFSSQIRIEELRKNFGNKVSLNYRFIPIFGAAKIRIEETWREKGGLEGFNRHLHTVATNWTHITLHPKIWLQNEPASSSVAHLYLKAVQLLENSTLISTQPQVAWNERTLFEELFWRIRCAFFEQNLNIAHIKVLDQIAAGLNMPIDEIHRLIDNGEAFSALHLDEEAKQNYQIPGSPTLVFNEGRQQLYGNVGYRIIEANIRELLHNKQSGEASWC